MVFFINIYNRATDPPDKDKGNQIGSGGDNDIVNNSNRYATGEWRENHVLVVNC